MSEPRNNDSATADALLKAIGRASRTLDAARAADAAPISEADDEALVANITRRLLAQQQQAPSPIVQAAPPSRPTARRRRPWWIGIAAAAASLAFAWLLVPAQFGTGPLPSYSAEVSGLDRDLRGATPVTPKPWKGSATIGNRLLVTLRPEIASESTVVAKLWHATGNDIEWLPVPLQRSSASMRYLAMSWHWHRARIGCG
jgi:hypothetical protein